MTIHLDDAALASAIEHIMILIRTAKDENGSHLMPECPSGGRVAEELARMASRLVFNEPVNYSITVADTAADFLFQMAGIFGKAAP